MSNDDKKSQQTIITQAPRKILSLNLEKNKCKILVHDELIKRNITQKKRSLPC